ncbi:hypothetical protein EJB05_33851, partial [Eragrostis curvula]
ERDVSCATTKLRDVMARKNQQGTSSAAAAAKERSMRKKKESGMEKQKEKGNEERKEKGEGEKDNRSEGIKEKKGRKEAKEGDAVGVGQFFFKKIPQSFCKYLKEEPNQPVSLKGLSGNTWQVMLTSVEEGLGFTQGWKEFVGDHSLKEGHFLMFTYDGHSEFSVAVFTKSGVEDKSALDAQPSQERVVKVEVEEGAQDADAASASEQEVSALPCKEGNGKTRKRVRQGMVKSPAPKRHLTVQKKPEKRKPKAFVDTSKARSTFPDSNKDLSCMLDEYSSDNKTRTRTKDVPRLGKVMSKKLRQPMVISQRHRVTEEEKARALKRAMEFKSKNPFTLQVGFFMNIPCEFVRDYLPQTGKKMTLWDPQGKPWEVQYVYYSERSVAAFSGGWGKFAVGNNLEKFDVCVFELLKKGQHKSLHLQGCPSNYSTSLQ